MIKFSEVGQAEGFAANIFERYKIRPLGVVHGYNFNVMNLMTFTMLFEPYYPRSEKNEDNIDQDAYIEEPTRARRKLIAFQNNTKMAVRNRPACVTVPYIIAANDPENYYYSLLLQYVPYRSEDELLDCSNNSREAFQAREELLREQCEMMEIYKERD
ncbi:ATP-dependent DNA helicase [Trichonephila inaurata madagascariensis]|uniref:ATP-dependent DNA helicase n=1 Tax=Trichonephila inaurata madagascariensis TaxID=2747483 RepID=A0A8X6YWY9_9ARAC|nr:ATP-dependent DNA helicase [Trichonephila inaurata madagascariensis]